MSLKNIVAVSGEAGLFKLVSNKNNGLILSNLDTGKTQFFSMRKSQFTPLETVGIYTMTDTIPLKEVFQRMQGSSVEMPQATNKTPNNILLDYFEQIVPEFDRDKVYGGDVKKVIKWYHQSISHDLLNHDEEE